MLRYLFSASFIFAASLLSPSDGVLFMPNANTLQSVMNASYAYMSSLTSMYGALMKPLLSTNPLLSGSSLLNGGGNSLPGLKLPGSGGSSLSGLNPLGGGSLLTGGGSSGGNAAPLEHYNVDKSQISTSGISSGGAMAAQMHVIYSQTFMGVGLVAGIPYACSGGSQMKATTSCMNMPQTVSASTLEHATDSRASSGRIDSTANMANDKVYIFNGRADTVVNPAIGQVTQEYYNHYLNNPANIKTVFNVNAQHGQPTDNYGASCTSLGTSHYIINCHYSAAYDLLNFIYGGNLKKPDPEMQIKGQLLKFNQGEFSAASMDSAGYIYIPSGCANKTTECKLHVAFHGCQQGAASIGDVYVSHAGYNAVGELNNIIILYPQAVSSLTNPMGCWDWWGYTGSTFDTNAGAQPQAVKEMIDRITG